MFKLNHKIQYLAALSLSVLYDNVGDEHTVAVLTAGDDKGVQFKWRPGVITGDDGVDYIVPTSSTTGRWERLRAGSTQMFYIAEPAADSADGVHALYDDTDAAFPGPFTDPDVPRNVKITYSADWDGGAVTVTGTDQFGAEIEEVIAAGDDEVVEGELIFATVTGATKETAAGDAGSGASIGWGNILGLPVRFVDDFGILTADGVAEPATFDTTIYAVTPTTEPDGAVNYVVLVNVT